MPEPSASLTDFSARASSVWLKAEERLGIRVITPYIIPNEPRNIHCIAYLPEFGGPNGIVISVLRLPDLAVDRELAEAAVKRGLHYSFFHPNSMLEYDESFIKEALLDWGFYGPASSKPRWMESA